MIDDLFYSAMNSRSNVESFKHDIYPSKDEIDKIIKQSIDLTPVKNNIYNHFIEIWGPEFYDEKCKLMPAVTKYNQQVKAPYLLIFKKYLNYFNKRDFESNNMAIGIMGAILQGYVISVLANKNNIQASFCACYIKDKPNFSKITSKRDEWYFMLGLGYVDRSARSDSDSKLLLPTLDELRKWI